MAKSEYQKKLLDPRWQKKRLVVLERDGWRCQICGDDESTLHVHHKYYGNGEPWEIADEALVALCADCHDDETRCLKNAHRTLIEQLSNIGATSNEFVSIAAIFHKANKKNSANFSSPQGFGMFERWLEDLVCSGDNWQTAVDSYLDSLSEKKAG